MKYFEAFPRTLYTFDNNNQNQQIVVDILSRSSFLRAVANNTEIAYEYQIKDSDTPEIIAHKLYGTPYRSWIILLFNNIINPYYDWPMNTEVLEKYIVNKYGTTISQSKTDIHHYEKVITEVASLNGAVLEQNTKTFTISTYDYNELTGLLVENALPTVADTSVSVSTETFNYTSYILTVTTVHKAISNYTHEFEENEKRRKIKVLDESFITQVETEFEDLMKS